MATPDIAKATNSFTRESRATRAKVAIGTSATRKSTTTVMIRTQSNSKRLHLLTVFVKEKLKRDLDEPLQEELVRLLNLMPELDTLYNERFVPLVEIGILALLSETPNIALAKGIREDIEDRVHRSPLVTLVRGGGSPPTRVILGLGTLLYFFIPLIVLLLAAFTGNDILQLISHPLTLVAIAGAVGSVVSIMIRIQDFESFKNSDPAILFFTGLFKPIIGTALALFVYMALNSILIPVAVQSTNPQYFFIAVGFVSGFSERFAKDIATRAEETIVAVQSAKL